MVAPYPPFPHFHLRRKKETVDTEASTHLRYPLLGSRWGLKEAEPWGSYWLSSKLMVRSEVCLMQGLSVTHRDWSQDQKCFETEVHILISILGWDQNIALIHLGYFKVPYRFSNYRQHKSSLIILEVGKSS